MSNNPQFFRDLTTDEFKAWNWFRAGENLELARIRAQVLASESGVTNLLIHTKPEGYWSIDADLLPVGFDYDPIETIRPLEGPEREAFLHKHRKGPKANGGGGQ